VERRPGRGDRLRQPADAGVPAAAGAVHRRGRGFRYVSTPDSTASGHYAFTLNNSAGYTLDLILPTGALQERQVWQSSNGLGELAAASLVVFGWVLTATVFAAAARVLQRD